MSIERLIETLSAIHPVTEKFKQALEREAILLSLPKNYLLLEAPRISDHIYFLDRGFAMSYSYVEGEKFIDTFWHSGQIVMSAQSFFDQAPALEYIQLMEPSEIHFFSYKSVMHLFEEFPEANFIYRAVLHKYLEQCKKKWHDLRHLTAGQRYEKLLKTHSRIEQIISQEYIASYLGVTPQSLSRIKRQQGRARR